MHIIQYNFARKKFVLESNCDFFYNSIPKYKNLHLKYHSTRKIWIKNIGSEKKFKKIFLQKFFIYCEIFVTIISFAKAKFQL